MARSKEGRRHFAPHLVQPEVHAPLGVLEDAQGCDLGRGPPALFLAVAGFQGRQHQQAGADRRMPVPGLHRGPLHPLNDCFHFAAPG